MPHSTQQSARSLSVSSTAAAQEVARQQRFHHKSQSLSAPGRSNPACCGSRLCYLRPATTGTAESSLHTAHKHGEEGLSGRPNPSGPHNRQAVCTTHANASRFSQASGWVTGSRAAGKLDNTGAAQPASLLSSVLLGWPGRLGMLRVVTRRLHAQAGHAQGWSALGGAGCNSYAGNSAGAVARTASQAGDARPSAAVTPAVAAACE